MSSYSKLQEERLKEKELKEQYIRTCEGMHKELDTRLNVIAVGIMIIIGLLIYIFI